MNLPQKTHKMTMLLEIGLCNSLVYNARIGYENTYDIRAIYPLIKSKIKFKMCDKTCSIFHGFRE